MRNSAYQDVNRCRIAFCVASLYVVDIWLTDYMSLHFLYVNHLLIYHGNVRIFASKGHFGLRLKPPPKKTPQKTLKIQFAGLCSVHGIINSIETGNTLMCG